MSESLDKLKNEYDLNSDGRVSPDEIDATIRMRDYENKDEKVDAQKKMTWYALIGMLIYPFTVILASYYGLDQGAKILGEMAAVYFGSVALIVAAFFGAEAYKNRN